MPSKAILYARVSTARQEREGYSLRQQLEVLGEHAAAEGYEVAEEIEDGGYSGATLERPGLDRVRDLVEAGGISAVIAQDADRITRNPAHRLHLDEEFSRYGCRLAALDDWGDDSHEGQLLRFLKGWMSQGERLKTAERSRRNKRRKAREGKIVGGHNLSFGFAFTTDADERIVGYEVEEEAMRIVRRIFGEIASGVPIRTLKVKLDGEGIPTPGGGASWSRPFIKTLITDDLYMPHTIEQLRSLGVSEGVLARLDERLCYGVYRFCGIAVPVPDSGVGRELILRAREQVRDNRSPSTAGRRFWTLSGGLLRCGECGWVMQAFTVTKGPTGRGPYHYYRCRGRYETTGGCSMTKNFPAPQTERRVLNAALEAVKNQAELIEKAEEDFERKACELGRRTELDAERLRQRLVDLEAQRLDYFRQASRGRLSDEQLDLLLAEVDAHKEATENTLTEHHDREAKLNELENQREKTINLIQEGSWAELGITSEEARHARYREIGLQVEAFGDGSLKVRWGLGHELPVSEYETSH